MSSFDFKIKCHKIGVRSPLNPNNPYFGGGVKPPTMSKVTLGLLKTFDVEKLYYRGRGDINGRPRIFINEPVFVMWLCMLIHISINVV